MIPEDLPELATDSLSVRSELPATEDLGRHREHAVVETSDERPPDQPTVLVERIAEGGMGEVWEGVQTSLGRSVAVKTVRPDLLDDDRRASSIAAFRHEAVVAASLEHPNIVPVHDLEEPVAGVSPRLVMKRVRGVAWSDLLTADYRELDAGQFLTKNLPILADVAQAVAFAHSKGIVHRDLKPAQVMVGEFGEVLLMDWGLSVYVGDGNDLDPSTVAALARPDSAPNPTGTPALMAPEQTDSSAERIGPWTDVYLLGGILYLLLTGKFPHGAASSRSSFEHAVKGEVEPPSRRAPERAVPPELEVLCMEALVKAGGPATDGG